MSRWAGLLLVVALLSSCRTAIFQRRPPAADVALYVESAEPGGKMWELPQSGVKIRCAAKPAATAADFVRLEVVTLELGNGLLVQLTPGGIAALRGELADDRNRRIVLVVNHRAIGATRSDEHLQSGALILFVEEPDSELPALVNSLTPGLGRRMKSGSVP